MDLMLDLYLAEKIDPALFEDKCNVSKTWKIVESIPIFYSVVAWVRSDSGNLPSFQSNFPKIQL